MSFSAFGIEHGLVSKAEIDERKKLTDKQKKQAAAAGGVAATGATAGVVATQTKIPEHSHYNKKTRKYLHSLPAGEHDVPTEMLRKRPRKLGARKQQTPYVAAMAQERPEASFRASPVPVTRYKGKGNPTIQRDNAHSVMANAMKGRTTRIKIEDAPGYRPNRRTGEELVRRGQMKFQEKRLKRNFNIGEQKIEAHRSRYHPASRTANTTKRPHGVVEESFKYSTKPYKARRAFRAGKNLSALAKRDKRRQSDTAAGVAGAAGVGTLAATPVRRTAVKADVSGGTISAKDAKKVASPGYRPGNRKAIKTMAANLGHLENKPSTVIQFKDKTVVPFDGNHRMTARVARGDKTIPVNVIQGGERSSVSVTRNAYHVGRQKMNQRRIKQGHFKPDTTKGSKTYTGRHTGERKAYRSIANASPARSGRKLVDLGSTRSASGPSRAMLRTKQGAAIAAGGGLLTTAGVLRRKKD